MDKIDAGKGCAITRATMFLSLLFIPSLTLAASPVIPVKSATQQQSRSGLELVFVPGGCFRMGAASGNSDARPEHEVCLKAFNIGKYEVTQEDWRRIMQENPARFDRCGVDCPVEQVSWNDISEYIRRLNAITGRSYRLPTEAEWEYACSGGGRHMSFCGGNDIEAVAWFNGNSNNQGHPIGGKQGNYFGIHDMSGNVWEWVLDWKGNYRGDREQDPVGPALSATRVRRGGSWQYGVDQAGRSWRSSGYPDDRALDIGFRLAHPVEK
jgi:formylglycine-generating enzyme required for sulfatase activity